MPMREKENRGSLFDLTGLNLIDFDGAAEDT